MDQDYFQKIEPIFLEAVKLRGDRRRAYLDRACAGQEALQVEIETLLAADESSLGIALEALAEAGLQGHAEFGMAPPEMPEPSMKTCKNGHSFDSLLYTLCPRCGLVNLKLDEGRNTLPRSDISLDKLLAGWLVCVKGPHLGEDYRLSPGSNTIGRSENATVRLMKDAMISKETHAIVTYDHLRRIFRVSPVPAAGRTFLNEALLNSVAVLQAHDTIEVGSSLLRFVPFCGSSFAWAKES